MPRVPLLALSLLVSCSDARSGGIKQADTAHAAPTSLPVLFRDLERDYKADPSAAAAKHGIRRYQFTAQALAAEAEPGKPVRIGATISTREDSGALLCYFDASQAARVALIHMNDQIVMEGRPVRLDRGLMIFEGCMLH